MNCYYYIVFHSKYWGLQIPKNSNKIFNSNKKNIFTIKNLYPTQYSNMKNIQTNRTYEKNAKPQKFHTKVFHLYPRKPTYYLRPSKGTQRRKNRSEPFQNGVKKSPKKKRKVPKENQNSNVKSAPRKRAVAN